MPRAHRSIVLIAALLSLPPALASSVSAAAPAVYGGEIASTDDPIVLRTGASGRTLASTVLGFTAACESGRRYTFHGPVKVRSQTPGSLVMGALVMTRNARGSFTGTYTAAQDLTSRTGSSRIEFTLQGRFDGRAASGTLRAVVDFVDVPVLSPTLPEQVTLLDRCSTGTLRWKASHRPGVVYGGATNQDEAIVLIRSKDRRSVASAHAGWHAACLPEGWVDFPETFTGFPLSAAGAFGDAFAWRYPSSSGTGENLYDYDLRGRLARGSGSGTFAAKVTYPDGSVCDSGPQRWSVRST